MTESKLRKLVTETVELDAQARELSEQLKKNKAWLVAEAEGRPEDQRPTEGGGTAICFEGEAGAIARVTFPAAALKDKLDAEGKPFLKIRVAAGKWFDRLFKPVLCYRPNSTFRADAVEFMGRTDGNRLIELCQTDSKPRVSFETKEEASGAP